MTDRIRITLQPNDAAGRHCGGCTLCCKLLPMQAGGQMKSAVIAGMIERGLAGPRDFDGMVADFDKPAGKPCPHQRHGKGCLIYQRRPFGCRTWSCRWLSHDDTGELRRPDRSRYVIDVLPDFITLNDENGNGANIEVVQIWVDPASPDAWREPALLAYIERRASEGIAALIRISPRDAIAIFAPALSTDGEWHEVRGEGKGQHLGHELFEGLAACRKVMVGNDGDEQ